MVKKSNKMEFIKKAASVHGDKYSYDEFEYINAITKGKIICKKHGAFYQSPNTHLSGHGCPNCAKENITKTPKLTFDIFEKRAKEVHQNKYEYIRTELSNNRTKVKIICKKHGVFEQSASLHLTGQGCPNCANEIKSEKMSDGVELFIKRAVDLHCDKYDYSNITKYRNNKTKVPIICKIHGMFMQTPIDHIISGHGCPKCSGRGRTLEDFVNAAKRIHGDKYEYTDYNISDEKIPIKCKACGETFYQKPWSHLQGHGCPFCNQSRLENEVTNAILSNSIQYTPQKTFNWLKNVKLLYLDFYLPQYNIAIECQGAQHFPNSRNFGGENKYELISKRDALKKELCDEHGIELIYFTHEDVSEPYLGTVFTNIDDLVNYIISKNKKNEQELL